MGERTGVMYRIGQKSQNQSRKNSDPVTRAIDFSLVIDKDKTQSQSDQDLVKQIRSKIPKGKKRETGPIQSRQRAAQKDRKGKEPFYSRTGKKTKREKGQRQKEVS